MTGLVHSLETLGALDGPGLRCVVFLQGCPLRCQYCHNPDTWSSRGGTGTTAAELVARLLRYRSYIGRNGGVTLSGGEPLLQPAFARAVLEGCREAGLHTAVDTSGACWGQDERAALAAADLVILDLKHLDARRYQQLTGGDLSTPLAVLQYAREQGRPLWVRQVVADGWNDTEAEAQALGALLREVPSLQRVELLPYHELAQEKWRRLGLQPRGSWAPPAPGRVAQLQQLLAAMAPGGVPAA